MMNTTAILLQQHEDASASLDATQAISELQLDLSNALALASQLETQKAKLTQELNDANAFNEAALKRKAEWKDAWKKERETVLNHEKQVKREEQEWRAKLDERQKELQELERKHQMNSERTDGGRAVHVELLKEIQTEHASKVEKLAEEASKWREQYYASKKNYEELQAQNHALQSQKEREVEISESFQKEVSSLQQDLADHIDESARNKAGSASEAMMRDLQIQLEEKELLLERLHQEVKGVRKDRDDAVCAKDEATTSHNAELGKASLEKAKCEADNRVLEQRVQAAKTEATQAIVVKAELEETLKCNIKEMNRLRETLVAKDDGHKKEAEQLRHSFMQSETQLNHQLASTKAMLVEEQATNKELQRRCTVTQEHAMQQISQLAKNIKRDDKSDQLLTAKDQIIRLENKCANLQGEINQIASAHQAEVERLQHACESCHKDLNLVLLEKTEAEKNIVAERMKVTELKKDLDESERELQTLQQSYEVLIDDKMKLSQQTEDLKSEKESLESKLRRTMDQLDVVKEQHHKEQRRSSAYKGKAIEAHQKSVKCKEVLDSICSPGH